MTAWVKARTAPKPPLCKGRWLAGTARRRGWRDAASNLRRTRRGDPRGRPAAGIRARERATARVAPTRRAVQPIFFKIRPLQPLSRLRRQLPLHRGAIRRARAANWRGANAAARSCGGMGSSRPTAFPAARRKRDGAVRRADGIRPYGCVYGGRGARGGLSDLGTRTGIEPVREPARSLCVLAREEGDGLDVGAAREHVDAGGFF